MIGHIKKIGGDLILEAINHHNIHDVIALLEDNEADVNGRNINGQTPLHYAVESQNKEIITTLLQYHADPNIACNMEIGGFNPMHRATELNMIDVMELFS